VPITVELPRRVLIHSRSIINESTPSNPQLLLAEMHFQHRKRRFQSGCQAPSIMAPECPLALISQRRGMALRAPMRTSARCGSGLRKTSGAGSPELPSLTERSLVHPHELARSGPSEGNLI